MLPSTYLVDQKLAALANTEGYSNQASDSLLYQNLLATDSVSAQEFIASEGGTRDVMLFIPPPNNVPSGMFSSKEVQVHCSEPISQHHGLSLSLGTQEPSLLHLHPDSNQFSNPGLCSFIHQDMQLGLQHLPRNDDMKNVHYLPFGSQRGCLDTMVGSNTSFVPALNQGLAYTDVLCNSKYIKAAQDLLHELVNAHQETMPPSGKPEYGEVAKHGSPESSNDLRDLQDKLAKLSSMLVEVDRCYKLYCNQLGMLASSFDSVAGRGAAFPYTSVTRKRISRQFRSLHDAIKKQIEAGERNLGQRDDAATQSSRTGTLCRLRRVDEQLRSQKAIQHFGVMRRPWRPQRGLPETAISILRAWLFEHFLHPYPSDSEKLVLATRAGLSRSQVANWFINARVRLWKPMIEDIYREEFGDEGGPPESPPKNAERNQETPCLDNREEGVIPGAVSLMDSKTVLKRSSVSLDLGLQNNQKDSSMTRATPEANHTPAWIRFSEHDDLGCGETELGRPLDQ